ncbi:MAG: hypothetical protein PHD32_11565 [Eubacteriales bacterium]|nr:hypothetical protein [Eubacteriales bacterium]
MKLYITGAVGSGKSTFARRLSSRMGVPCTQLDELVHVTDPAAPWGNRKRPKEERKNFGLEACIYRPNIAMLRGMFRWAKAYDDGSNGTKRRLVQNAEKVLVLKRQRDAKAMLASMKRFQSARMK